MTRLDHSTSWAALPPDSGRPAAICAGCGRRQVSPDGRCGCLHAARREQAAEEHAARLAAARAHELELERATHTPEYVPPRRRVGAQ